ncbi:hypothetical protein MNBD_ALPHA11-299 [hydrothermal vent metagenome]|uniref:Uncharacterized protein n=1 Tax=hydrothermal vent metagenome TaxID=652676 RepID=A0A3B0UQZ6_9ZZZZ
MEAESAGTDSWRGGELFTGENRCKLVDITACANLILTEVS